MFNPEKISFKGKIIDITAPISPSTPVFPGDPEPSIEKTCTLDKDGCSVSRLILGSHTGTHVDAPSHILKDGLQVDKLNLETLMGPAVVLDFSRISGALTDYILDNAYYGLKNDDSKNKGLRIPENIPIILLKTKAFSRNEVDPGDLDLQEGERCNGSDTGELAYLDAAAAAWIVHQGFKTVGIDNFSVDSLSSENLPVHHTLLSNNVNIVECLDLSSVEEGIYFFLCMPLKIEGCDGAPARVLLISCS